MASGIAANKKINEQTNMKTDGRMQKTLPANCAPKIELSGRVF
jgi:hypothetical protein